MFSEAQSNLDQCLAIANELNHPRRACQAKLELAKVSHSQHAWQDAKILYSQALDSAQSLGTKDWKGK